MLIFKSTIAEILNQLKEIEKNYTIALKKCPQGTLHVFSDHGRPQYVQITYVNGKRQRRGINRNQKLLQGLARKQFLESSTRLLRQNIQHLSNALNHTADFDPISICQTIQAQFPKLPEEYFFDTNQIIAEKAVPADLSERIASHQAWAAQEYERSTYMPQNLRITTSQGLKVRTKSEALIAERLFEYGIPFRYEQVLHFGSSTIVPDYTFEAADGRELYWEHAGMLDHPRYSFRHHMKLMQYESCGIYPWQHLLITYDTNNIINMPMIDAVIQHLLLPQL